MSLLQNLFSILLSIEYVSAIVDASRRLGITPLSPEIRDHRDYTQLGVMQTVNSRLFCNLIVV